jgi:alkyl hydroperoxide reductase subunit AhpF
MPILQTRDEEAVRKEFERLTGPVTLVVFSQELVAADLCRQNEHLMKEVAALSDKITVQVLNPQIDRERAEAYGVTDVPLTIPAGYEFSNLIDAIIATSRGESGLSEATKATLATLPGEVEIKVFSTPT